MILVQILVAIIAFGFLVFFHELFHYLAARMVGVKPKEFAVGFGKSFLVYQKKKFYFMPKRGEEKFDLDTISYHLKILPLGGYVLFERPVKDENGKEIILGEYYKVHPLKRIIIALAGPIGNFVLAFAIMFAMMTPYMSFNHTGEVMYVKENSIAEDLGMQKNDRIISYNGNLVKEINSGDYVQSQKNLCIKWEDGEESKTDCVQNNNEKIGVTYSLSIWNGVKVTFDGFVDLVKSYAIALVQVILNLDIQSFNGPVGTVDAIQQTVPDMDKFLSIIVLVSIALGAVNLLLPLSILDGGKIVVDLICLIRRKNSIKTTYLDFFSFGVMILLFLFTFVLDVSRILDRIF